MKRLRRAAWISVLAVGLISVGMLLYVGGRLNADDRFIGVVLFGTYLALFGFVLFTASLLGPARRAARPAAILGFGVSTIVFGVLLVVFPFDRRSAVPMAMVVVLIVASMWFGRSDFRNRQLWYEDPDSVGDTHSTR